MIIYDFSQQDIFSLNSFIKILLLLFFAFFAFLLFIYKPKKNSLLPFIAVSPEEFRIKNKWIAQFMCVFSLAFAFLIIGVEFKSYLYVKHINLFEKIETINGKITKVDYMDSMRVSYINFQLNNQKYSIVDDERYVSYRNLVANDSVKIDIIQKDNKNEVIKIYLVKKP